MLLLDIKNDKERTKKGKDIFMITFPVINYEEAH